MPDKKTALFTIERRRMAQLLAGLAIASLSGFVTYLYSGFGTWQQWTYLLHTLAGFYLTIVALPYVWTHFKRTIGVRRPTVVVLGVVAVFVTITLAATGVHIGIFGQSESLRWINHLHILSAYAVLAAIGAHMIIHRLFLPRVRRSEKHWFASITYSSFGGTARGTIVSALLISVLSIAYAVIPDSYSDVAKIEPYATPYGPNPFSPSLTKTSTGGFLDAKRVTGSRQCGACHQSIVDQWEASIHSQAGSDKAYNTSIGLLTDHQGIAAARYCETCHAPATLLSGQLTPGGDLDSPDRIHEGVSCLSCHNIDRVLSVKGVGSYEYRPTRGYLFAGRENYLAVKFHNYLVRIQPRQHRAEMARPVLSSPTLCATCHAQFMDKDVNHWGWVKMQDEFSAWLDSPYSKQSQQTFSKKDALRCQDCHMPREKIADPSANRDGLTVSHRTLGANTAIPFLTGNEKHLERTREFLQSDKIRISIDRPSRKEAVRSEKPVTPGIVEKSEAPVYFYLGEKVQLNLVVTNIGVGHEFPGGTTDINEAWIRLQVTDAQDRLVYESGAIQPDNSVDSGAHFYRTLAINREGKHVWQHDLFNMVGDSYKKVIPSGSSDVVQYEFPIPSWAKGPLTVSAVVRYRKLNQHYAQWALKDRNIRLPIVDMARDSLQVALRERHEAR